MKYKDYIARIEFNEKDGLFVGHLLGIKDIVSFHGETVKELREDFENAVNSMIEDYVEEGLVPPKPFSGKFNLRPGPDLHCRLAQAATAVGKSLNQWVVDVLEQKLRHG